MVAKVALLWEPLKISLLVASAFCFVQALVVPTESSDYRRPVLDCKNLFGSSGLLLARAGNMAFAVSVKLERPVFDMLYEASADLGEWVLSRPASRAILRSAAAIQLRERSERHSQ